MTDLEILVRLAIYEAPWVALVVLGTLFAERIQRRVAFRRYEQARRRYSEWRLRHLDEI